MISSKKLIRMARKWQRIAAIRKRRISAPISEIEASQRSNAAAVAEKGFITVCSADERRFVLPIEYLNTYIIAELLKISEEEFGLPRDGLIRLPIDAVFMDYLISLIKRRANRDMEKAFIMSMTANRCYMHYQERSLQQSELCSC